MKESPSAAQVRVNHVSPTYWRVILNNPPLNLMGPEFVLQFREVMAAIESDEQLRVVVFESAVEGFFLNHSDFNVKLEELTRINSQFWAGSNEGMTTLSAQMRSAPCTLAD